MLSKKDKVNLLTLVDLQESELQDCEKKSLAEIIDKNDDVERQMRVGELRKLDSISRDEIETVKRYAWEVMDQREQEKEEPPAVKA